MVWRAVPNKIGVFDRKTGAYHADAPVQSVTIHPPNKHPAGTPLVRDSYALEIKTPYGTRWQGFRAACIDSRLRAVVDTTGRERDEVLARWKKVSGAPCGDLRGLGRVQRKRRTVTKAKAGR